MQDKKDGKPASTQDEDVNSHVDAQMWSLLIVKDNQ
jgi:hypothetical protein